eukprot:7004974-Prymnesium_polylepis.1
MFKMRELRGAGIVTVELVPTGHQSGRSLHEDPRAPGRCLRSTVRRSPIFRKMPRPRMRPGRTLRRRTRGWQPGG